mgnify:CR=1 FL=1
MATRGHELPVVLNPDHVARVQQALLAWYAAGHRDLPWRQTRDPYRILVSEIMLQQTQVERVIPKYHAFLAQFPTVEALARAPLADVIRAWAGLGYNRRARYVHQAAQAVCEQYGGEFPHDRAELERLPGVGRYTAGAIACFAFEQDVGFWDTNIARVLHRVFVGPEIPRRQLTARQLDMLANALVPPGRGYDWNQALIELGAVQCTARRPACLTCPLLAMCRAAPSMQAALAQSQQHRESVPFTETTRYFRGRIIAALRALPPGAALDLNQLGPRVHPAFTPERLPWLRQLVDGLARDGLVEVAEPAAMYDAGTDEGIADDAVRVRLPGT